MTFNILSSSLWLLFYYTCFIFIRGLYRNCLRPSKDLKARYSIPNVPVWACVTGATSGIGLQFVRELARRGFNIILVSRSKKKLEELQQKLKSEFKEQNFTNVVADFGSDQTLQFYKKLAEDLLKYDIGLLVNNAGVMYTGAFLQTPPEQIMQTMQVNIFPAPLLTHYLLPKLRSRKARSGIINVSSIFASQPAVPYNAIYSATKSFDDFFSLPLAFDNDDKLDILSVKPGPVHTQLLEDLQKAPFITISVARCVKGALRCLGYQKSTNGDWVHGCVSFLASVWPEQILSRIWGVGMRIMKASQKKEK